MAIKKCYGHYLDTVLIGAAHLENCLILADPRLLGGAIKITVNYITNERLAGSAGVFFHILLNN